MITHSSIANRSAAIDPELSPTFFKRMAAMMKQIEAVKEQENLSPTKRGIATVAIWKTFD